MIWGGGGKLNFLSERERKKKRTYCGSHLQSMQHFVGSNIDSVIKQSEKKE